MSFLSGFHGKQEKSEQGRQSVATPGASTDRPPTSQTLPFFWILGVSRNPTILRTTVGHLKEAIVYKKQNALPSVDADELASRSGCFPFFINSSLQLKCYNSKVF
jgi:hypothetical protein